MTAAIRALQASELPRAAHSLASAFADDPVARFCMPERGFREALTRGMQLNLEVFTPFQLAFTDAEVNGVALWARHDQWRLPPLRELALLPGMLRVTGAARLPRLLRGYEVLKRRHPHDAPHYYLYILGVRAELQGRGLGRALVQPMLERCDAEGMPAYLESSKPDNVPFYRGLGFEEREPLQFGRGGPTMIPMWRPPRARR